MNIAALQRCSLSDYPGKLAAIVFCRGCNFRCPYCHNPELLDTDSINSMDPSEVLDFLESRRGKLDAVVITGGEPTLHSDELILFTAKAKKLDYQIKLDTNGARPDIISQIIHKKLVDYIALDVKAPPEKYSQIVGAICDWRAISESIALIMNSGIDYEFRTTIAVPFLTEEDIESIAQSIQGARRYILQPYSLLNPPAQERSALNTPTKQKLEIMRMIASPLVNYCEIRS